MSPLTLVDLILGGARMNGNSPPLWDMKHMLAQPSRKTAIKPSSPTGRTPPAARLPAPPPSRPPALGYKAGGDI